MFLLCSSCVADIAPKLGDGSTVDWFFAYKLQSDAFPNCSTERECIFGGTVQNSGGYYYGWGMQYLLASNVNGTTQEMSLNTDCIGTGADPVAQTFQQIYGGSAPNYILWNDQFYREPSITLSPECSTYSSDPTSCSAPWGHSKGALAWDADGNGFVMQVTTPDWPGSGSSSYPRETEGNTLGCCKDDNVEAAQQFFALKLTSSDVKSVVAALQQAMVVTDPNNPQVVKLTDGPSDIAALAQNLAQNVSNTTPYDATLSSGVRLIAKPSYLYVPPWQLVSAMTGSALRTATWWDGDTINSQYAGTPGCWSSELGTPLEVQVATSGQWAGKTLNMTGTYTGNHAKIGYSLNGTLNVMGDMNQDGSYDGVEHWCGASQNGRGGLFFVLDDAVLHQGLVSLLTGDTAPYGSSASASQKERIFV
jgi:hypothetical protein